MSVTLPGDGAIVATVVVNGAEQQIVQVSNLPATQAVSIAASVAVTGPVTDTQLRLSPVPVSGAFFQATQPVSGAFFQATQPISGAVSVSNMVAQGLTDTQLRLTALPVSGAFFQATQPVSGPATDVQLRATPLPVSMSNTLALTDTQIRATPLPVSGTVAVSNMVAQGLTDTQIRATALPVSGVFFQALQPIRSLENGMVSTLNSSAVVLGIGGVYTGTAEDVTEYADIRVFVFSDQASATDGLQIQQSSNGTNWDISDQYSIPAATGKVFSVGVSARFLRLVYTNGAAAQTAFRLQIKLHKSHSRPSSVRPQDGRGNDNDMDEVLSHLMGFNGVNFDRLRSTVANGLAVDVTRVQSTVSVAGTRQNNGTANVAGSLHLTVGGSDGVNLRPVLVDTSGRPVVNVFGTVATVEPATIIVGQAAQTAVINNILDAVASANATDVSNLRAASVQVVSTGTGGTYIFEQSNDNINFRPLPVFNAEQVTASPTTTAITATASQIMYSFPIRGRFIRLRIVSLITGGSIQSFSRLSSDPWTSAVTLVANPAVANLQALVAQGAPNAAPWLANPLTSQITAEASSAKIATGASAATITNPSATGVMLFLNASVVSGTTPSLQVRVQVQDPVSAAWVDLPGASFAAITAVTATPLLLVVGLGVVAVANAAVNMPLPRSWRLAWVISGTTPSFTFSVGAQYVM